MTTLTLSAIIFIALAVNFGALVLIYLRVKKSLEQKKQPQKSKSLARVVYTEDYFAWKSDDKICISFADDDGWEIRLFVQEDKFARVINKKKYVI